ncbi:MAG TPA: WG repeat-containing protein, partial [Cyclobacteriaceae bacterium]|nr:WG repeat-containing protein [Cyclobacteriaceae bacterium]
VKDFNHKTAICTEEGKWITGFVIDEISDFTYDYAIISNAWKKGVINRNGDVLIDPSYREIRITGPETAEGRRATEWRIIDPQYKTLQTVQADDIAFGLTDWTRMTIDGKTGFIGEDFETKWAPAYEAIGSMSGNIVLVKKEKKWGLLNRGQREVLPFEFDTLCLSGNLVRASRKTAGKVLWSLYDTVGVKKTDKDYDLIENPSDKFFPARSRGYWGMIDRYGKETVACVYDSLLQIKDGLISVLFKGDYGIVTVDDQWRVMPQSYPVTLLDIDHYIEKRDSIFFLKDFSGNSIYFTTNPITVFHDHLVERLPGGLEKEVNLQGQLIKRQEAIVLAERTELVFRESEGLIGIKRDGKFGFVDSRGRLRIANRYDNIGEFHDGLAAVSLLGKWGFINKLDQIDIQPTFDTAGDFDDGVSLVSRQGKYGLIDKVGNTLLDLRYDSIEKLPIGKFVIVQQSMKGLVDSRGRVLIEPRFDSIVPVDDNLVIVNRNGMSGVLTYEGISVFPMQFETLTYIPQMRCFLAKQENPWETIHLRK